MPRLNSTKDKANAVRSYLNRHGGFMDITVVDKPGINRPAGDRTVHKDRILTFDCGLRGLGMRVKAYQHLTIDGSTVEPTWFRECKLNMNPMPPHTTGLRKIPPPADVSVMKPFTGGPNSGTYL